MQLGGVGSVAAAEESDDICQGFMNRVSALSSFLGLSEEPLNLRGAGLRQPYRLSIVDRLPDCLEVSQETIDLDFD